MVRKMSQKEGAPGGWQKESEFDLLLGVSLPIITNTSTQVYKLPSILVAAIAMDLFMDLLRSVVLA